MDLRPIGQSEVSCGARTMRPRCAEPRHGDRAQVEPAHCHRGQGRLRGVSKTHGMRWKVNSGKEKGERGEAEGDGFAGSRSSLSFKHK